LSIATHAINPAVCNFSDRHKIINPRTGEEPSDKAFIAARQKLLPSVWRATFDKIHEINDQHGQILTLHPHARISAEPGGLRLVAGDGTTHNMPPAMFAKYCARVAEQERELDDSIIDGAPQLRMVLLHDVLNQIPYDADWSLLDCSERELLLACKKLKKGVLFIGDRGYPSAGLYAMLDYQQVKFVIRVPLDRRIKAIKSLLESGQDEIIVDLKLDDEQRKFCAFHGLKRRLGSTQRVRLVKVTLADGTTEILATNLRCRRFPPSCFSVIYKMRWGVETFFDHYKHCERIEGWSGTSPEHVDAEIMLKLCAAALCSIFTAGLREAFRLDAIETPPGKRIKTVNRRTALFHLLPVIELLFLGQIDGAMRLMKIALRRLKRNPNRQLKHHPRTSAKTDRKICPNRKPL
jgi:hypothetical protein